MTKPAARVGDMHVCPIPSPIPHVGGPILLGCPTVLIGGPFAARMGDMALCVGPPDVIALGSPTVLIGGVFAARLGDMTAHGGTIVVGCPTVLIGEIGFNAYLQSIVDGVNPSSDMVNCGQIIDAVRDRLTGKNPDASAPAGIDGSLSAIEKRHGTKMVAGSIEEAWEDVRNGGHGTTAMVNIAYGGGGSHIVVITNHHGTVAILEGQEWGDTEPKEVITSPEQANNRYNEDGKSKISVGTLP